MVDARPLTHHIDRENDIPRISDPVVPAAKTPHIGRRNGYLPIRSYGIIGDCRSSALVGVDGSIDWMCLPRFQDPSLFGALLDQKKGGYWEITPVEPHHSTQRYLSGTNVLETVFYTSSGSMRVLDFMPVAEFSLEYEPRPSHIPRCVRIVEGIAGRVRYANKVQPAPDYGTDHTPFEPDGKQIYHANCGEEHFCFRSAGKKGEHLDMASVAFGGTHAYALYVGASGTCPASDWSVTEAKQLLEETVSFWHGWIGKCTYTGPYVAEVHRSALALKLLTYSPTGAVIAAATTSVPEKIHGKRNWDYRFTWLRDAAFSVTALVELGFLEEAHQYFSWLEQVSFEDGVPNLFSVHGDLQGTDEAMLKQFEGYRRSRPVRIGNAATHQRQWDVFGEVVDSIYKYCITAQTMSDGLWHHVETLATLAVESWTEPDASIWEIRGPHRHFTYSLIMCWVAVDRALRLAERFGKEVDTHAWSAARQAMRDTLSDEYFHHDVQAYTQARGLDPMDAAVLRLPGLEMLSNSDPRIMLTIDRIQQELGHGPFVHRYLREGDVDGMPRGEGAFLICSFWLVEALAEAGALARARTVFDQILAVGSPLNLLSEEIDIITGDMLGNFPQAFSHLGLIEAALALDRAEERQRKNPLHH